MRYNKFMSNCNDACRPGFVAGPPAPGYTTGCSLAENPTFKTFILPASVGTDEPGQPYAPKIGEFRNAIVVYESNGNIYIYDSLGTPTRIEVGDYNHVGGAITGPKVTQSAGDSTTTVMSQKAVTYELEKFNSVLNNASDAIQTLNITVKALSEKVAELQTQINGKELGV